MLQKIKGRSTGENDEEYSVTFEEEVMTSTKEKSIFDPGSYDNISVAFLLGRSVSMAVRALCMVTMR